MADEDPAITQNPTTEALSLPVTPEQNIDDVSASPEQTHEENAYNAAVEALSNNELDASAEYDRFAGIVTDLARENIENTELSDLHDSKGNLDAGIWLAEVVGSDKPKMGRVHYSIKVSENRISVKHGESSIEFSKDPESDEVTAITTNNKPNLDPTSGFPIDSSTETHSTTQPETDQLFSELERVARVKKPDSIPFEESNLRPFIGERI